MSTRGDRAARRTTGVLLAVLLSATACGGSQPLPEEQKERNIQPGLRETPRPEAN